MRDFGLFVMVFNIIEFNIRVCIIVYNNIGSFDNVI